MQIDPEKLTWIDADTFELDGSRYRVEGYDAPEKAGIFVDKEGTVRSKAGQLGGAESATAIQQLFLAGGYDQLEETGAESEGRKVVRLKNKAGDDLTGAAYRSGIIAPNLFTSEANVQEVKAGRLRDELRGKRAFEDAYESVKDTVNAPRRLRESVVNEKEYRDGLVQVAALQAGLDLNNPDEYVRALQMVQDGEVDRDFNPFSGVDFRTFDRDITNVAKNQTAEAWRTGWRGMLTGIAGFGEAAGVLTESEATEKWGTLQGKIWQDRFEQAPDLVNVDWKDIDGIWSGAQWFTNNVAMSVPYLAVLAGGTLASPLTGGASAVAAFGSLAASYGGQVWNDMEGEKGKAQAAAAMTAGLAMAVVDRLGFGKLLKPSQLLTKEGREQAAQALATRDGISIDKAREAIVQATRAETKDFIKGIGDFASANIARSTIQETGKRIGVGSAIEGLTESIQEGIGYATAVGASDKEFNQEEFNELLVSSFITGGAIGGGFTAGGQAYDAGQRVAIQRNLDRGDSSLLNDYARIRADLGNQGDVDDIILSNKEKTKAINPTRDEAHAAHLAAEGKIKRSLLNSTSISDGLVKLTKRLPELYRAAATTAFRPEVLRKSPTARKLYALVGQPLGKLYSGRDVEAFRLNIRSEGLTILQPKEINRAFGLSGRPKNSQKISDWVREYVALGGATVRKQDLPPHLQEHKQALDDTIARFKAFSEWDYKRKNETFKGEGLNKDGSPRKDLQKLDDWWLKHQNWDWKKVRQNRDAWFKFMRDNTTETPERIQQLYNKITNAENQAEFSLVEGVAWKPGSFKGREQGVSGVPGYEQFANTNIIENLAAEAELTSSYAAYTTYFGEGGKDLDQMFREMQEEGLTEDEIHHIASHVKDIIDAGTGNYEAIRDPKLAKLSRMIASYTTSVGLVFAALSSFPEFAMAMYGARDKGDLKGAWDAAKEVTGEYIKIFKNVLDGKDPFPNVPDANRGNPPSQTLLNDAGIFNDDASVATRYGLADTDIAHAWWMQNFFKFYLITGVTQMQRKMAAAAATGFISDRIKLLAAKPEGAEMNREQLEIYTHLTDLGMDVDKMVDLYEKYNNPEMFDRIKIGTMDTADPHVSADLDFIDDQMNTAIFYFVNERVQAPQAHNRPLVFQDPHFQLLTQFNGFTSTFMATKVPKIWGDYIKNGTPTVKYNTFAMMIMMIGLAGASQWLRDYLKFGKSSPYLNEGQLVQRAFQASGLLGTGERVVQAAFPLYEERGVGLSGRLFGESIGAAPAWRTFENLGGAIGNLREGETERAASDAFKLVPGFGQINPVRNVFTQFIHGDPLNPYPNR